VSSATVLISQSGGVTRLTLNRPDRLNAFTRVMHLELREALAAAGRDESCRVVVLTGSGRAFCAGQDLADTAVAGGSDAGNALEELYNPLIKTIASFNKPIIAAVNGVAAGAGANIALACDLVYATRSASFLQAFARIGLIPDAGGTWVLPRLVGPMRARGLAMLAEPLPAEKAEAWGLIWKCLDDDHLRAGPRQAGAGGVLHQHACPAARPGARPATRRGRVARRTRGHPGVSRETPAQVHRPKGLTHGP
jgi:2-(1,2-epoxy-1,2-dihydrophenyl)acetyl-CoA isomerase